MMTTQDNAPWGLLNTDRQQALASGFLALSNLHGALGLGEGHSSAANDAPARQSSAQGNFSGSGLIPSWPGLGAQSATGTNAGSLSAQLPRTLQLDIPALRNTLLHGSEYTQQASFGQGSSAGTKRSLPDANHLLSSLRSASPLTSPSSLINPNQPHGFASNLDAQLLGMGYLTAATNQAKPHPTLPTPPGMLQQGSMGTATGHATPPALPQAGSSSQVPALVVMPPRTRARASAPVASGEGLSGALVAPKAAGRQSAAAKGTQSALAASNSRQSNKSRSGAGSSSQFRGVTKHRHTLKYEAHLWDSEAVRKPSKKASESKSTTKARSHGKQIYLGGFSTEEDAARAYDRAALVFWGDSAQLNFMLSDYDEELPNLTRMTREDVVAALRRGSSGFSRGQSRYRGVTRHHQQGRWEARIGRVKGENYLYLGTYTSEKLAAVAYDHAALKLRKGKAITNFASHRYLDTKGDMMELHEVLATAETEFPDEEDCATAAQLPARKRQAVAPAAAESVPSAPQPPAAGSSPSSSSSQGNSNMSGLSFHGLNLPGAQQAATTPFLGSASSPQAHALQHAMQQMGRSQEEAMQHVGHSQAGALQPMMQSMQSMQHMQHMGHMDRSIGGGLIQAMRSSMQNMARSHGEPMQQMGHGQAQGTYPMQQMGRAHGEAMQPMQSMQQMQHLARIQALAMQSMQPVQSMPSMQPFGHSQAGAMQPMGHSQAGAMPAMQPMQPMQPAMQQRSRMDSRSHDDIFRSSGGGMLFDFNEDFGIFGNLDDQNLSGLFNLPNRHNHHQQNDHSAHLLASTAMQVDDHMGGHMGHPLRRAGTSGGGAAQLVIMPLSHSLLPARPESPGLGATQDLLTFADVFDA